MKQRLSREYRLAECDHMRLVVWLPIQDYVGPTGEGGRWHHLAADGIAQGVCEAAVYSVDAIITGEHFLVNRIKD